MNIEYIKVINSCTQLSHYLNTTNQQLALSEFKKTWHNIEQNYLLFNQDTFQNSVISFNINTVNNILIHNFLMDEAKNFFKDDYNNFINKTNQFIFTGAISLNHVEHIRQFLPETINCEECLKISIKYGAWDAFNYFLEEHIPQKQHKKIVAWSHREFWHYHHNNYGSYTFFFKLVNHPLSKNKPLKKEVYTLLNNSEFSFVHQLIKNKNTCVLFKDINVSNYYKLLLKNLITQDTTSYQYKSGIKLLITSKQVFNFDFSNIKILPKFKKSHPEITHLLEKFILKDKLDLLPEKTSTKTYKI